MALSHRVERIAEQVREEISLILATEVRDPRIGVITVTRAKVTGDLSLARIYWTIVGDTAEKKKTKQGLEKATPYIRMLLSQRLALRRSLELVFQFDESVVAQERVEQIIQEIHAEDAARSQPDPAPGKDDDGEAGDS